MTATLHELDQRDVSAYSEPGHLVLLRWHDVHGKRLPMEIVRLSLKELGLLVCYASEGWAELCWPDQLLRAQAVANIIGGLCPPLTPPNPESSMSDEKKTEASPAAAPPEFLEQFFAYEHLPPHLQVVSETLPRNQERTVALRKLLEAKDCAVRALVAK